MKGLLSIALICGLVGIGFAKNNISTDVISKKPSIAVRSNSDNMVSPQALNNKISTSQETIANAPVVKMAPAREMNYQGWLGDVGDTAGVTGDLAMIFRIYDAATAGTKIWEETHMSVHVEKGIFNVTLGSVTSLVIDDFLHAPELWLETQVVNDTLAPRKKIVHAAYAINADYADFAQFSGHADTANYAHNSIDNLWTDYGTYISPNIASLFRVYKDTISNSYISYVYNPAASGVSYWRNRGTTTHLNYQTASNRYAGYFSTSGDSSGTDYGIYASCSVGEWAGYFNGDVNVTKNIYADNLPGVSSKYFGSSYVAISGDTALDSVTINVPDTGVVVVLLTGYFNFRHTSGTRDYGGVSISKTHSYNSNEQVAANVPGDAESYNFYKTPFAVTFTEEVGAGNHTYYTVYDSYGGGVEAMHSSLVATYYPNTHGTIVKSSKGVKVVNQDPANK